MGRTIDVDDAVIAILANSMRYKDPFVTGIALGICIMLNDEKAIPTKHTEKETDGK